MELFDAIKSRRSIRQYKPDPVDNKAVEKILDAGRWAPSWGNSQCWRFIVVRNPEIKAEVADSMMKIKLPDRELDNPGKQAINTVPVLIVVCAEMKKSGCLPGSDQYVTDKGDWFMFDVALAVQNMVLAAHAQGFGTVILGAFDALKVKKILSVPDGYKVVTLFPVGVPDQKGVAPPRKEPADICFNDKWIN